MTEDEFDRKHPVLSKVAECLGQLIGLGIVFMVVMGALYVFIKIVRAALE